MSKIAQNFTLRLILTFTISASLLWVPGVSLLSEASQGQGQGPSRDVRPRPKKPEGTLPDLEEVKKESNVEREAPPPIPSTMRAKRNEGKPWDGRRVGDPGTSQRPVDQPDEERLTRRAHARRRATPPPPLYEDQFIQNFFSLALLRSATSDETLHWNDLLRAGYNQNQTSLKLAAIELGRTLFESASYLARNRDAHSYVYDLYKTYLMRAPDAGGWAYWEALVPTHGREYVRRGFEESGEFASLLATISLSGAASTDASSLITARVDPRNQPGNGMLSRDARWSVSLISLPGRNGLDLGLALSYSSMVWTRSGPYFYFDEDNGFPSPGFRLGFPTVQRKTFDAQTGKNAYLLITSAGHRVELRQIASSTVYEAADSSYLQLTETGATLLVRSTDGTQLTFVEANNEYRCTQIKDRNGNYLSVNYNTLGQITNITDTLGRVITFIYDGDDNLLSITQAWNGQPSHQWVSFGWSTPNMQYTFADVAVVGIKNSDPVPVITQVALNDTSHFTFEYTNPLQVSVIKNYFGTIERNAMTFSYETLSGDVPRLNSSSVSAQNWTGVNGLPAQITTQYSVAGDGVCVMTAPDGTIYKEYYGTGWQKGLTTLSEIWSGGVKQKWTTTAWTQDNTSVNYETNPRVTETNVYDVSGNRRRTVIDYGQYANWGLPYLVKEYAANGDTEIRRTFTDYNLSQTYLDRRIIGLVSAVHLTDVGSFQGKVTYDYDDPQRLTALPASATQHDTSYNTSFTPRGNLTSVSRWDFNDINNTSKKLTSYTNYYVTGTPASATDPSTHTSTVSYTDVFSDNVIRTTFAYPTTLTDADGNSTTVQYNFDFGATTRTQSPAPAGQSQGTIKTMTYNGLGQLERVTNNDAYKRFWYGPNYVASYATVNNVADELYAIQVVDGLGRVIGATSNHPGSHGGYSLVSTIYDQMGRTTKVSNPTEIDNSWRVSGDDEGGIYYTEQTYDWKGRPLVTTNTDLTTRTASYSGCGCAGGEVVTLTDEGTINGGVAKRRQEKIYSDVLGRTVKTEVLTWQGGSVYSTTVNTYNVRDQITQIKQYAGAEGSGTYQDTTMSYDGYGRLKTKHLPQQQVDPNNSASSDHTTWDYNSDDTVQTVTDARGVVAAFSYNNRHLTTGTTYTFLPGVPTTGIFAVAPTTSTTFQYDAAANRVSMTDATGTTNYSYNSLSQLTNESRSFNGLSGSYNLNYQYTLAGGLKKITDPTGMTINYNYDALGRLTGVTGEDNLYAGMSTYASAALYRAWGALKDVQFGDGSRTTLAFNQRMKPTRWEFITAQSELFGATFTYYNDGRLKYSGDLNENKFDRAYEHDHLGRLKKGLSGAEARGLSTPDGPYRQTYEYNSFSNMTGRTSRFWSREQLPNFTATYQNNRVPGGAYDAEGNGVDGDKLHKFDAAGNKISVTDVGYNNIGVYFTIDQLYDGNGNRARRVDTRHVEDANGNLSNTSETTYFLRSTVLRGAVISELVNINGSGVKQKGFVYAAGSVLAEQGGFRPVTFLHHNPGTTSWIETEPGNTAFRSREEMDPVGAEVGSFDPFPLNPNPSYESLKFGDRLYEDGGNPLRLSNECTLDGIPWDCVEAANRIGKSAYISQTNEKTNGSSLITSIAVWVADDSLDWGNVDLENQIVTVHDGGGGRFVWIPGPSIQTTTTAKKRKRSLVGFDDLESYKARIGRLLTNEDCVKYIQELLDEVKGLTGRQYGDILTTFSAIRFYWTETDGAHGGYAYWEDMGTVRAADISDRVQYEKMGGSRANQLDRRGLLISQTTQAFLAETMHHLSQGGRMYGDADMANALNAILVRKGLDTPQVFSDASMTGIENASRYWHPKVDKACPAPRD